MNLGMIPNSQLIWNYDFGPFAMADKVPSATAYVFFFLTNLPVYKKGIHMTAAAQITKTANFFHYK